MGSEASLEEVGHWKDVLEGCILSLALSLFVCPLAAMKRTVFFHHPSLLHTDLKQWSQLNMG